MSRALKVKTRGPKGVLPLPPKGSPSPAQNISNYDGRVNMGAGDHLQQLQLDDVQGAGQLVGWLKPVQGE